jgi:hypothetical protein
MYGGVTIPGTITLPEINKILKMRILSFDSPDTK